MAPDLFDIVDISDPAFDAKSFGLTPAAVQKHMHVLTPEGKVVTGVDAFAHVWSRIPYYRVGAKVIVLPVVYEVAKVGYEIFANVIRPRLPKKNRF